MPPTRDPCACFPNTVGHRLRSSLTPRSRRRAISASSDLRSGRAGPILIRGTGRSGRLALGAASGGLAAVFGCNPVHPGPIHFLGAKLEFEALAHHAGQEATHGVLLPAS